MEKLSEKKCKPCEGGASPLTQEKTNDLLSQLNEWALDKTATAIQKTFHFKNYFRTIGFVNAVAWIANQEEHHPDLTVSYNRCNVSFTTHAIKGLSENDFICAAKVDQLIG